MNLCVLEIDDTGLRLMRDGQVVANEPGLALVRNGQVVVTGAAANREARLHPRDVYSDFWYALSDDALPLAPGLSRADIARAQLQSLFGEIDVSDMRLILVVPVWLNHEALGLLLGILASLSMKVHALVDASVAATRSHYLDASMLHVDISLHCIWVARARQGERTQLEDFSVLHSAGSLVLQEQWARWLAAQFVSQCRFDPLHSAQCEQQLHEALPSWLGEATRGSRVSLKLLDGTVEYAIEVDCVDLINVVAEHYQRIAELVRSLSQAGEQVVLQLTSDVAALPGLVPMLAARCAATHFLLPPDAGVFGAWARASAFVEDSTSVVRELPLDKPAIALAQSSLATRAPPTHLLLGDKAIALNGTPLQIGARLGESAQRGLQLEGELAGVSSLHCEITISDGQCVLIDHSRYGTFLNGNRINRSAILQSGDSLRIGTPGQELTLIRVQEET